MGRLMLARHGYGHGEQMELLVVPSLAQYLWDDLV